MSCVCILTPVVIAAWPAFSAAVTAAAVSLGYAVAEETTHQVLQNSATSTTETTGRVNLDIPNSQLVTSQLGRDQRITVSREGVTITFSRDARGRANVCVSGQGHSKAALRALGEQLSQRVVQQYVYQRLVDEMRTRQYVVLEEETDANHAIRLKVRHWEN